VAGLQKGIHDGERSNLFFEAIRIIREMREATNGKYPRYAVFENVPGAFSSNNGSDFQAVLQAFCDVCGERLSVPKPERWSNAGFIRGNGYSVAWRVLDAQHWGTPQRRKRIYLVADFGDERAGEVLFEPKGMSGHSKPSETEREGAAADAQRSVGGSGGVRCLNPWDVQSGRLFETNGAFQTLQAGENTGQQRDGVCYAIDSLSSNSMKSRNPHSGFHEEAIAKCLDTTDTNPSKNQGGNVIVYPNTVGALCARADSSPCVDRGQPFVAFHCQQDPITDDKVSPCIGGQSQATVGVCAAFMGGQGEKAGGLGYQQELSPTLKAMPSGGNTVPDVVYCLQGNGIDRADTAGCNGKGWKEDTSYTLNTIDRPAVAYGIHQNSRDEVRESPELSYTLSTGGGKPGQGNPAVCIDCRNMAANVEKSGTIQAKDKGQSLNYINPVCYDARGNGNGQIASTLTGDHQNRITDYTNIACYQNTGRGWWNEGEQAATLRTPCGGDSTKANVVCYSGEQAGTLDASYGKGTGARGGKEREFLAERVVKPHRKYIVRRLTTTECQRLQGMPEQWHALPHIDDMTEEEYEFWVKARSIKAQIDGKPELKKPTKEQMVKWYNGSQTDSAVYRMYGNGLALPCAEYVIRRVAEEMRKEVE
jgi:DNA (cytosine-5)-methyltransferase 1